MFDNSYRKVVQVILRFGDMSVVFHVYAGEADVLDTALKLSMAGAKTIYLWPCGIGWGAADVWEWRAEQTKAAPCSGEPELCGDCEGYGFRGPFGDKVCPCDAIADIAQADS